MHDNMRTLILGAKGQLGRDLMAVFRDKGETFGYDLPELDIGDAAAMAKLCTQIAPELIINAAAYTDVDGAEDNIEAAFRANEAGARNAADAAAYHGIPVVYYSTDYVFDGTKGKPYSPEDPIAPMSVYGRSKAAGESATRKSNPKHFILRTAWLYGPGGNNFVEKILRAAASRPSLRVVDDEFGSPTHTHDLAEATYALACTEAYGIYHVVNTGVCSRYEQVREILMLARLSTPVERCSVKEYPMKAARPLYSVLDTAKLTENTGYAMRPWHVALSNYMKRREPHP
jgi:dTDP-4-dehydrorhamnose reductase